MFQNYRDKIQNCRNLLLNKFRGPVVETDLKETLNEIYKSIPFSDDDNFDLEYDVLEEIGSELVQEETEWYLCCFNKWYFSQYKYFSQKKRLTIVFSLSHILNPHPQYFIAYQ